MSNPCCELGYCALDGLTGTIICCDCGKPITNEEILGEGNGMDRED